MNNKEAVVRVYRLKIATITAYRITNLAPELGDRRKDLMDLVVQEESFLSKRYPGVVFFFNRTKPSGRLWRERNFKIVRLGSIARLQPEDELYTYYERDGMVCRGTLNLGFTRLITEADQCDAESCGELLVA
jgi:hypothetical protein